MQPWYKSLGFNVSGDGIWQNQPDGIHECAVRQIDTDTAKIVPMVLHTQIPFDITGIAGITRLTKRVYNPDDYDIHPFSAQDNEMAEGLFNDESGVDDLTWTMPLKTPSEFNERECSTMVHNNLGNEKEAMKTYIEKWEAEEKVLLGDAVKIALTNVDQNLFFHHVSLEVSVDHRIDIRQRLPSFEMYLLEQIYICPTVDDTDNIRFNAECYMCRQKFMGGMKMDALQDQIRAGIAYHFYNVYGQTSIPSPAEIRKIFMGRDISNNTGYNYIPQCTEKMNVEVYLKIYQIHLCDSTMPNRKYRSGVFIFALLGLLMKLDNTFWIKHVQRVRGAYYKSIRLLQSNVINDSSWDFMIEDKYILENNAIPVTEGVIAGVVVEDDATESDESSVPVRRRKQSTQRVR